MLKTNPQGMSLREISEAIGMNRVTVARHLDVLIASGRVEMVQFGQAKVFYLSQRVPVKSLINCLSDIILVVDDRMKIRQFNTAFLKFFGGTEEDYYGIPVGDVFLSDDNEGYPFVSFDMALRGRTTTEEIAVSRGEEKIDLNVYLYPCIFENGERSVSIVMTDISGLKRNDELLRINIEMVKQMSTGLSTDEVFKLGAETAERALKADATAVFFKDHAGFFSYRYSTGCDDMFDSVFGDGGKEKDLFEKILDGRPVCYSGPETDDKNQDTALPCVSGSLSGFPLFRDGTIEGFIVVFSKKAEISDIERDELELISCQMSYALGTGRRPESDEKN